MFGSEQRTLHEVRLVEAEFRLLRLEVLRLRSEKDHAGVRHVSRESRLLPYCACNDRKLGRGSMAADENATIKERYLERNRTRQEIRTGGAIGSLNSGIEITTHGLSTRIIAWPGNGFQTESLHVLTLRPGEESESYRYDRA